MRTKKETLQQKIMANYMASLELAALYRREIARLPRRTTDIYIVKKKKEAFENAINILKQAQFLRVNALYFCDVQA